MPQKFAIVNVSAKTQVRGANAVFSLISKYHGQTNCELDTLGIEPRAFRMRSGCDTTTPCALGHANTVVSNPWSGCRSQSYGNFAATRNCAPSTFQTACKREQQMPSLSQPLVPQKTRAYVWVQYLCGAAKKITNMLFSP